jgi:hypothetical protein
MSDSAAVQQIPLPPRLASAAGEFVGRRDELEQIADAWSRVAQEPLREIVLVAGEAGLGKTTLAAKAARAAHEQGADVLFGHCEEDLIVPYQLFVEALSQFVTHASEEQLRAHVAEHGSELSRIVPALAKRIPELPATRAMDADSERSLLFAAAVDMLATASEQRPLVLMLDDIQWADNGSLLLLRHLAVSDRPMSLLILATYRDNETTALLDTLAALHRQTGVTRLDLAGLADTEVLQCVETLVGPAAEDVAADVARAVHRETDGNPFFVSELLRHLKVTGAISEDGRWVASGPVESVALPESVLEVIGARIARLGKECARALRLAAVIGREFDFEFLGEAARVDQGELLEMLDQAEESALIEELDDGPGRYRFTHALIQHALYQDLNAARRIVAHRDVARALDKLHGDQPGARIGELARHWCFAPQSDDAHKAIRYAYAAGEAALAALVPAEAIDYFTSATELVAAHGESDTGLELDLAIGLGTAQRQNGDPAFRDTLLAAGQRAAELGDTQQLVRAVLANNRGWHSSSGSSDAEKVAQLELALQRLPEDVPERALVIAALCAELAFGSTLDRRQALAGEAIRIGRASGHDHVLVPAINQVAFAVAVPSLLEDSLQWTAEALNRAEQLGDPMQLYFAAMYRATAAIRANDIAEADRCFAIARGLVDQLRLPPLQWEFTFHMAKRAQLAGDLAEAERLATEAFTIGSESGQPDAETTFGVQLAAVSWMRGTMGDLAPLLEGMIAENPGLPTIRASLAMAYAQAERREDAARILGEFADSNYYLPQDTAWLNGMTEYADAAICCADPGYAQTLYDVLEPWEDQFSAAGGFTAEGPVCLYLGALATVLERYDDAERHLLHSTDICAHNGMKFYAALTELRRAQLYLARGLEADMEPARRLLESAKNDAQAGGYGAIERAAGDALESMAG